MYLMYLFGLKGSLFSLITDAFICLLRVILKLRDCCKAWQFTLERWMLLLLICRQHISTELRGIETHKEFLTRSKTYMSEYTQESEFATSEVPQLNYTGS